MSNVVLFYVKDNINYEDMNSISRKIVKYCLKKDLGVSFNFFGYCDEIVKELNPTMYFIVSDDFIQLNSEFLTTSNIFNIKAESGKIIFSKRFRFFNEIFKIFINNNLKDFGLLIMTDGSSESINDCEVKKVHSANITETLFGSIIENKDRFAYDFPNLLIKYEPSKKISSDVYDVIRKNKKILENNGFEYSWFPGEESFEKDGVTFVIFTYEYDYQVQYMKNVCKSDELHFAFDQIEFKDQEKNNTLLSIKNTTGKAESLDLFFQFILNNFEWLKKITEDDVIGKCYKTVVQNVY